MDHSILFGLVVLGVFGSLPGLLVWDLKVGGSPSAVVRVREICGGTRVCRTIPIDKLHGKKEKKKSALFICTVSSRLCSLFNVWICLWGFWYRWCHQGSLSVLLISSSALVSSLCFYSIPLVWIMNAAAIGSTPLPYVSLLQSIKAWRCVRGGGDVVVSFWGLQCDYVFVVTSSDRCEPQECG